MAVCETPLQNEHVFSGGAAGALGVWVQEVIWARAQDLSKEELEQRTKHKHFLFATEGWPPKGESC